MASRSPPKEVSPNVTDAQIVLVTALEGVRRFDEAESKEIALEALWNLAKKLGEEDFLMRQMIEVYCLGCD